MLFLLVATWPFAVVVSSEQMFFSTCWTFRPVREAKKNKGETVFPQLEAVYAQMLLCSVAPETALPCKRSPQLCQPLG